MNQASVFNYGEKEAIDQIEAKYKNFSVIFHQRLPEAQKRTLHRLIQAILREHVVDVTWKKEGNQVVGAVIPGKNNGEIIIPISKQYVLHHIDIKGDILYFSKGSSIKIDHPVDLLDYLSLHQDVRRLSVELQNSVVNYALALTAAEIRKQQFSWEGSLLCYFQEEARKNPQFSPLVFAEQWVIEGHTIHPCSKTRIGLSEKEMQTYSPEWEGRAQVIPVAVHRDYIRMKSSGEESMTTILLREYPDVKKAFLDQLSFRGVEKYELIPVHPWQLEHTIITSFKEEITEGIIIPLKGISIPTSALMSFRSLAPERNKRLHHIKTAVDIQMTSAKRIVSPTSVWNGPVISSLLKRIEARDSFVGSKLWFMEEKAGGHFKPKTAKNAAFLAKNLSALLRESPEKQLADGEIAVPAAFFINQSPFSGKLFLVELIDNFSRATQTNMDEAAIRYIYHYANCLLPGLLTLITKYGISLEAHLQNVVAVIQNGIPVRFLLRDNGGIRIKEERLKRMTGSYLIDNRTNLLTDNEKDLFTMFSHALLHNHLGEMILVLTKELGIQEKLFWKQVKEVIYSTINHLKEDNVCEDAISAFENEMSRPMAPLKAMLKMRMTDQITDNAYTLVPNPLADKTGGEDQNAY